ncbi:MAG: hypothetical protein JJU02_02965 [Cryomorphaceae bacterium]|nr:hypothetical protein [Cryomorphaceae bacterium]
MVVKSKYGLLILVILAIGCTKPLPPEEWEGDPVFVFQGSVNNEKVSLGAGLSGRTMQTSYFLDTSGYWVMRGTLGPRNCPEGCENSLIISYFDEKKRTNVEADRSHHTRIGHWKLPSGKSTVTYDTLEALTFYVDSAFSDVPILWDFQFGDTTSLKNPTRIFDNFTHRLVCLSANLNSCLSNVCNRIYGANYPECQIQFSYTQTGNTYTFYSQTNGPVRWEFGDGNIATGDSVEHTYTSNHKNFRVCAYQLSGCDASFCRDVPTYSTDCGVGYSWSSRDTIQPRHVPPGFEGRVMVEWINMDGERYVNYLQKRKPTDEEYFETITVEPYKPDPNGNATVIISAAANLWLFSDNNDSIPFIADELIFALPQPE